MAYQQNVVAQNNAASSSIARQLQSQAAQKYRAKAEQLQQNETDLSLRLTQQDAAAAPGDQDCAFRIWRSIRARASKRRTSWPRSTRTRRRAVSAQRNADAATLRAYRGQLDRETGDAIRSQVGAITAQTRAKLEERRNEVGAQLRSLGPPRDAGRTSRPTCKPRIAQIHRQFVAQFQADAAKTMQEYKATKNDLDRQFAALHGADVGATGAARQGAGRSCRSGARSSTAKSSPKSSARRRASQKSAASASFSSTYGPPRAATISPTNSSKTSKVNTSEKFQQIHPTLLRQRVTTGCATRSPDRARGRAAHRRQLAGIPGLSKSALLRRAIDSIAPRKQRRQATRRARART